MRHRRSNHSRAFGEINVTPLIDVVMCLIIFYLMVGKLAGDRKTRVDLPESIIGQEADPEVLIVNVVPVGGPGWPGDGAQVVVERATVRDASALQQIVRDRLGSVPQTVVQVRAEKDLDWRVVAPVLQACTQAGANSVRLATDRPAGAPAPRPAPSGGTGGGAP